MSGGVQSSITVAFPLNDVVPVAYQMPSRPAQTTCLPPLPSTAISVPLVFWTVAPMRPSTVSGSYGTTMPVGLSITCAAAPRVHTPSALTLATPTAAPSSGSSPPVEMNGAPIGRGTGMSPSSRTAGKMR